MAKARLEDVRWFDERCPADDVATALLGTRARAPGEAAIALAGLAADPRRLATLLASLPGGALAALDLLAEAGRALTEAEIAGLLDLTLGAGRGGAAFRSLHGRGFLEPQASGYGEPRYALLRPFAAPLRALLAGMHLVDVPAPAGPPPPDVPAFAVALLLGSLASRPRRVARTGGLFRKEAEDLEALFAPALGERMVTAWTLALERMGIAYLESLGPEERSGLSLTVDPERAQAFLAEPRPARVRKLAAALELPRWLGRAFEAGERFVPRAVLERAERLAPEGYDGLSGRERIAFLVAAGVLEERAGALRAAPVLRGAREPDRPASGRWHVQPNLEVLVPPDVPLVDAFRLARVAEVVSVDRAGVLSLAPAALARAAERGLDAEAVLGILSARAAVPLADVVRRAAADGARSDGFSRLYDGYVVAVPPEALARLRARPDYHRLVRSEIAPGVLWLGEDLPAGARKAFAAAGAELRSPGRTEHRAGPGRTRPGEEALARHLALAAAGPGDAGLSAALSRAAAGEEAEYTRTGRPLTNGAGSRADGPEGPDGPDGPDVGVLELDRLIDDIAARLERGQKPRLERVPAERQSRLMHDLARVLRGDLDPGRTSQTFRRDLRALLAAAPRRAAEPPSQTLSPDWQPVAEAALAGKRDLWLALSAWRRPRLVTPHRLVRRGGEVQLEALAHDSGDLRAWRGDQVFAAALAGPSAPEHLPAAYASVIPLRAARNEKCPCGSNRKYKHCCLEGDLAAAAGGAQLAEIDPAPSSTNARAPRAPASSTGNDSP